MMNINFDPGKALFISKYAAVGRSAYDGVTSPKAVAFAP
jgi:hypothetical protein